MSVWVRVEVLDTDAFVNTAGAVARDPAVQREVSDRVGTTLVRRLDADGACRAAQAVLPELQGLASPLAVGADAAIRWATTEVVASDRFEQLWETPRARAHRDALRLAHGETVAALHTHDGRIAVDLEPVVDAVVAQLPGPIAALVPPVTTGDDIVLFRSDDLAAAQPVVRAVDSGWSIPPVICLSLLVVAMVVASRRRRRRCGSDAASWSRRPRRSSSRRWPARESSTK